MKIGDIELTTEIKDEDALKTIDDVLTALHKAGLRVTLEDNSGAELNYFQNGGNYNSIMVYPVGQGKLKVHNAEKISSRYTLMRDSNGLCIFDDEQERHFVKFMPYNPKYLSDN